MSDKVQVKDGSQITLQEFAVRFCSLYDGAPGIQRDMDFSTAIVNIHTKQHITAEAMAMLLSYIVTLEKEVKDLHKRIRLLEPPSKVDVGVNNLILEREEDEGHDINNS